MATHNRQVVRMVTVLGLVAALSGIFLAAFYGWINPIVESRKQQEVIDLGLKAIFPDADTFEAHHLDDPPQGVSNPVYEVWNADGARLGFFINATGEGWSTLHLAVGFDPDRATVTGVRVLEHQETPGLGSRVEDPGFLAQFVGKSLTDPFEAGQDVDMITGATVSTRGVATTVANASRAVAGQLGFDIEPKDVADTPAPGAATVPTGIALPKYADASLAIVTEGATVGTSTLWDVKDDDGNVVGVAVFTSEPGYGGPVDVVTVIDPASMQVLGATVVRHNESPGLGDAVAKAPFISQFVGKDASHAFRLGEDIDGITLATESSQAVTRAIQRAVMTVTYMYGGDVASGGVPATGGEVR